MFLLDFKLHFIHIPKTGGSSVGESLRALPPSLRIPKSSNGWEISNIGIPMPPERKWGESIWHQPLSFFEEHVPKDMYDDYTCFTVVRNPFSRLRSEFFYRTKPPTHNGRSFNEVKGSFKRFVIDHLNKPTRKFLNMKDGHFVKQSSFVEGTKFVNIFKTENIQELEKWLQLKISNDDFKLKHVNKCRYDNKEDFMGRKCSEYYDTDTISLVQNIYRQDFEKFDYSINIEDAD